MADSLRQELRKNGWNVAEGVGPIVPLILGDVELALKIGQKLEDQGFAVGVIRPPTVPKGTARLRISVNAGQTQEEIDRLVAALVISVRMD
jgi:8-amino-7-oxononanoate synthase